MHIKYYNQHIIFILYVLSRVLITYSCEQYSVFDGIFFVRCTQESSDERIICKFALVFLVFSVF